MQFNVLGALEMAHEGKFCTPTAPKVRWVLALLVAHANRILSIDALIEELWGDQPPRSAITTTQTYIYQLRRCMEREGMAADAGEILQTRPPGYLLRIQPESVDAYQFEQLTSQGRALLEAGDALNAAQRLREALNLWRGPAMANVTVGRLLEAHVAHLNEQRVRALELRIEADRRLGRHRELIPELRSLVIADPLNEWIHGQLIDALSRAGRRGEALRAYQSLRNMLKEELGLEPSAELQRLQYQVLRLGSLGQQRQPAVGLALG